MAGVLLARQGVDVVVCEKYPDFFRDFRGDTIHPSTLELFRELGWLDELLQVPHTTMERVQVRTGQGTVTVADFSRLPVTCPYITFMPQWDFLAFLATKGEQLPRFRLLQAASVGDLVYENGSVVGARATTEDGDLTIRANLVIGADGRHSTVRRAAGLTATQSSSPIDVLWFRLDRQPGEYQPLFQKGRGALISINRGDYWQLAYVVPAGAGDQLRAQGIREFLRRLALIAPELQDRVAGLGDWGDVHQLTVKVDRLRTWHRRGVLCIGDSAHAMSPAGGVGINLAVQDAVATANILGPILARRELEPTDLDRVRRRRLPAARATQAFQVKMLKDLYPRTLNEDDGQQLPFLLRGVDRIPLLPHLIGRFIGLGLRPEHIRAPSKP
ncbi:FAD-dependent oxidoreductase [Saxibacter everestensis]|uniref:FAD-dependent oxidoreductase n=1 Tax=Saxibacter everestensis TaxID=2909229 RepID=A0ABY8QYR3_9MICO|nr:FAD-dependent oxidoreductase [Brevibacteriaceae bacterium ZFBP1038]